MTTRTRALEVDLLRFVAICAMCTLHVVGTWQMMSQVGLWTKLLVVLVHDACQMCVPVLFLLSMYLMARGFPGEWGAVPRWLGQRLKELLPPALVWAALYWAVGGWLQERELWATWFLRFYVGPMEWVTPLVSSHLWYMFALVQMVVLFPGVYGLVRWVSAGRTGRAQALVALAFLLKGAFCWYVFRPGEQSAWLAWVGLMGPFWLDLMLFAMVWLIPGALRPAEGGGREWLVVLGLTLIVSVGEVHRLAVSGMPGLVAHSNWRFGNALYGVAVFAVFLANREALARRVSERFAGFIQRFNREYSFAFYLAHILLLTLAGNVQIHVLRLPPAASLVFLAVTTVAGTMGLLAVVKRVPGLRFLLGVRPAARSVPVAEGPAVGLQA